MHTKLQRVDEAEFQLIQRASAGDESAFEELYRLHHNKVFSVCYRMLQNTHDAEDLTQDVFIHLHKKLRTFRGDSKFSTWLHRMTVNFVLMHWRKKIVMHEILTEDGEMPISIVTGTNDPNKMRIIDKIALENALARLPEGYRKVFTLHDIEGYEHKEVGQILGSSEGNSKSQLFKARKKLKKELRRKANPRLYIPAETALQPAY